MFLRTFDRGSADAALDSCENCPFASIGGQGQRHSPQRPSYIPEDEWPEYLAGYEHAAQRMYGDDWRTCAFSWAPVMTLHSDGSVTFP